MAYNFMSFSFSKVTDYVKKVTEMGQKWAFVPTLFPQNCSHIVPTLFPQNCSHIVPTNGLFWGVYVKKVTDYVKNVKKSDIIVGTKIGVFELKMA